MPLQSRWLISRRADLSCIVLSPLLSPLLLGIYALVTWGGNVQVEQTARVFYYVFTVFFDHPHILQTFSRTHFDATERKRHFAIHHWILGGALLVAFFWPDVPGQYWFQAVFDLAGLWHIYAQNAGFLKVYGRFTKPAETDRKLERAFFFVLFNAYLFRVLALDLGRTLDEFGTGGPEMLTVLRTLRWVFLGATGALLTGVVWRQFTRRNESPWTARQLFLAALTVNYFVNYWAVSFAPVAVMLVFDTLYHDIQYMRWMAHYQERNVGRAYAWKWALGCGLLALLVFHGEAISAQLVGKALPISSVFLVVTLYHYFVDGIVWKFGKQPELQNLLKSTDTAKETQSFKTRAAM